MESRALYALIEPSPSIYCAPDALGSSIPIAIGGYSGTLHLPLLPAWTEGEADPLHTNLRPPPCGLGLRRGRGADARELLWGRPVSYPDGRSEVGMMIAEFPVSPENAARAADSIYRGFGDWHALFLDYVRLISRQGSRLGARGGDGPGRLAIVSHEGGALSRVPDRRPHAIEVFVPCGDNSVCLSDLRVAARLGSVGAPPRLEYRLLLGAYEAHVREDFRIVIVEAASAVEVCLERRIRDVCGERSIAFVESLLRKYKTLGGKCELARLLDISFGDIDYWKHIVEPRNRVVHEARYPDLVQANQTLSATEALLRLLAPHWSDVQPNV